ncbi:uncharacterized protein LOC131650506 [Vicia villosa]|uniref:uncharacterized protein LOC131650506 n=1 Tax=Vicia villosa TaxID=3911 RepID=UPI00273ADD89|nr:uncharacterized protein LOC131650506 [Vicia villosa]
MDTIKSNKACAACEYQWRKCLRECFAPNFPADKPIMFHSAHCLYGVSTIARILNDVANVRYNFYNNENNIEIMMNASPLDNIPRDINNTPTNTNLNINSMDAIRVAQLSEGLLSNTHVSANDDLKEEEEEFDVNNFFIPDSEIDRIYNGDEQSFVEKDAISVTNEYVIDAFNKRNRFF